MAGEAMPCASEAEQHAQGSLRVLQAPATAIEEQQQSDARPLQAPATGCAEQHSHCQLAPSSLHPPGDAEQHPQCQLAPAAIPSPGLAQRQQSDGPSMGEHSHPPTEQQPSAGTSRGLHSDPLSRRQRAGAGGGAVVHDSTARASPAGGVPHAQLAPGRGVLSWHASRLLLPHPPISREVGSCSRRAKERFEDDELVTSNGCQIGLLEGRRVGQPVGPCSEVPEGCRTGRLEGCHVEEREGCCGVGPTPAVGELLSALQRAQSRARAAEDALGGLRATLEQRQMEAAATEASLKDALRHLLTEREHSMAQVPAGRRGHGSELRGGARASPQDCISAVHVQPTSEDSAKNYKQPSLSRRRSALVPGAPLVGPTGTHPGPRALGWTAQQQQQMQELLRQGQRALAQCRVLDSQLAEAARSCGGAAGGQHIPRSPLALLQVPAPLTARHRAPQKGCSPAGFNAAMAHPRQQPHADGGSCGLSGWRGGVQPLQGQQAMKDGGAVRVPLKFESGFSENPPHAAQRKKGGPDRGAVDRERLRLLAGGPLMQPDWQATTGMPGSCSKLAGKGRHGEHGLGWDARGAPRCGDLRVVGSSREQVLERVLWLTTAQLHAAEAELAACWQFASRRHAGVKHGSSKSKPGCFQEAHGGRQESMASQGDTMPCNMQGVDNLEKVHHALPNADWLLPRPNEVSLGIAGSGSGQLVGAAASGHASGLPACGPGQNDIGAGKQRGSNGGVLVPWKGDVGRVAVPQRMLMLVLRSIRGLLAWAFEDEDEDAQGGLYSSSGGGMPKPAGCHVGILVELVLAVHE